MELLDEINEEHQRGNLSDEQIDVFNDYINHYTYNEIKARNGICCNNIIVRVIIRTIQLQYWFPGFEGGNDFYLCDKDVQSFYNYVCENSNCINCLTCSSAIQLAADIKRSRTQKAIKFLKAIKKINLIHHISKTTMS